MGDCGERWGEGSKWGREIRMQELRVWGNKTGGEMKGAMRGKAGARWNVWGCGVRVCIILYILLYYYGD